MIKKSKEKSYFFTIYEFINSNYEKMLIRHKIEFIKSFARFFLDSKFTSFIYEKDLLFKINVELSKSQFLFSWDTDKNSNRRFRNNESQYALACLYSFFLTFANRSDCLRFYREVRRCQGSLKYERSSLQRIQKVAIQLATKKWHNRTRLSTRNNSAFVSQKQCGFKIHRVNTHDTERLLDLLLPNPDQVFSEGVPLSGRGSGCSSVRIVFGSSSYFLKRYDCRGLLFGIKNIFRSSRGMKVWRSSWGFLARDLPVPKPLIFIEERHFRVLGRAYILSEYNTGAERLMNLWPSFSENEKDSVLIKSAMLLGRVNRFNCIHGDTNWDNLLIVDKDSFDLLLVDLDCAKIFRRLSANRALRDVQHFVRDLCRPQNSGESKKEFFLAVWRKWFR